MARLVKAYPGIDPIYATKTLPLHMFLRLLQLSDSHADAERTREDAVWMQEERLRREGLDRAGLIDPRG